MSTAPRRNVRTREFRTLYGQLPEKIRGLAVLTYRLFLRDPENPSLGVHRLKDTHRGQHPPGSIAVYINRQYRAIYFEDGDTNVWCWIGSHSDYNSFTGRK